MSSGLPRNVKNGSSRVSPCGSVFLSYRHSDGAELAIASAWALSVQVFPYGTTGVICLPAHGASAGRGKAVQFTGHRTAHAP